MFCKNSQRLNTVNYFCKKLHLRCFTAFWIRLWLSSLNVSLCFFYYYFYFESIKFRSSRSQQLDSNNHLVHKQTLNHLAKLTSLAKWLSAHLWIKGLWVRVQLQLLKLPISRLLWARSFLTFKQLQSVDSLWSAYVTWQEHTVARSQMSLKIDVF